MTENESKSLRGHCSSIEEYWGSRGVTGQEAWRLRLRSAEMRGFEEGESYRAAGYDGRASVEALRSRRDCDGYIVWNASATPGESLLNALNKLLVEGKVPELGLLLGFKRAELRSSGFLPCPQMLIFNIVLSSVVDLSNECESSCISFSDLRTALSGLLGIVRRGGWLLFLEGTGEEPNTVRLLYWEFLVH
jgi:hypothetical protein